MLKIYTLNSDLGSNFHSLTCHCVLNSLSEPQSPYLFKDTMELCIQRPSIDSNGYYSNHVMYMMEDHLRVISPSHWGTKEFLLPHSAPASTVILHGWWNALLSKKPTAELCTLKYWKLLLLVNGLAICHWVQFCPLEANREHITLFYVKDIQIFEDWSHDPL